MERAAVANSVRVSCPSESGHSLPIRLTRARRLAGWADERNRSCPGSRGPSGNHSSSWIAARFAVVLVAALTVIMGVGVVARVDPTAGADASGVTLPGTTCPAFPADNVWNTPVTDLPVNANSAGWLATMSSSVDYLHPDFGPSSSKQNSKGDRSPRHASDPDPLPVHQRKRPGSVSAVGFDPD